MPNDRPTKGATKKAPAKKKAAARPNLNKTTSVTEWKKPGTTATLLPQMEGFITDLPSGNRVKMARTLDMTTMLAQGKIPNPLAGVVQRMIDNRSLKLPDSASQDVQMQQQILAMVQETTIACVIEPPIAGPPSRGRMKDPTTGDFIPEDPDEYHERINQWECPEGHISVFDVSVEDQAYIFAVAQGAAADLAQFREFAVGSLAHVSGVEGVRKPTKRTGGSGSKKKR